jgi:uncharacterized cofD-like protein
LIEKDPNIVLIGGGTGLSYILKGLKKYPLDITAIVAVSDDGGSSGVIRDSIHVLPPGDIRKVMIAMSESEPLLSELLTYRFNKDTLFANHSVGNILLTALFEISGDYVKAVEQLSKVLNVKGTVLPVATTPLTLCAKMQDGEEVIGESKITAARKKIDYVYLKEKDVQTTPQVINAINEADMIVFSSGSLYTSIIPNLLVPEVCQAIIDSTAKKVYVCNVMTETGETDNFTVSQHVKEIEKYIGDHVINSIIANVDFEVPEKILMAYQKDGSKLVEVDYTEIAKMRKDLITAKFLSINERNYIRHNSKKIAASLLMMILEEVE